MAIKIQDALKNNEIAIGYLILTYVLTKIISSDDIFLSMRSMVLTSSNCKLLTSQGWSWMQCHCHRYPPVRPNIRSAEFRASVVLNHSCCMVLGLHWP